jgi:AcrR family transcriptional regulator
VACLPLGLISQWFRGVAGGRPGALTEIGLRTFVDPRLEGGQLNARSTANIVDLVSVGGQECLFLPRRRIDVVLLRGTTADPEGRSRWRTEAAGLSGWLWPRRARIESAIGGREVTQLPDCAGKHKPTSEVYGTVSFISADGERMDKERHATTSRGAEREEAILAAAAELITEIGYDRVTVDAIATRARASKATMYRRWAGKAELIAETLRRASEGGRPSSRDTGTVRGDLVDAVAAIARAICGAAGPSLLGLVEGIRSDHLLRGLIAEQIEQRGRSDAREICARALARGDTVSVERAVLALDVAVARVLLLTLLGGAPPDDAAQAELVDEVLLPLLHTTR